MLDAMKNAIRAIARKYRILCADQFRATPNAEALGDWDSVAWEDTIARVARDHGVVEDDIDEDDYQALVDVWREELFHGYKALKDAVRQKARECRELYIREFNEIPEVESVGGWDSAAWEQTFAAVLRDFDIEWADVDDNDYQTLLDTWREAFFDTPSAAS